MNRLVLTVVSIISLVSLFGCGIARQPVLTIEQMSKYPTVISLAKDRYTNLLASSGQSHWKETKSAARVIASFEILSFKVRIERDEKMFFDDMSGYCQFKNGIFKDIRRDNQKRKMELYQKYSYQQQSNQFECGPEGRGTRSDDWTKFNPAICRTLTETKLKEFSFNSAYGTPPDYQCEVGNGVLFIITMSKSSSKRNDKVHVFIKINEAIGAPLPTTNGTIDML